jgi:hypothetical protein
MIYNLLHWLQQQFPSITFVAEGVTQQSTQNRVEVLTVPGRVTGYPDRRSDDHVQITVRDSNMYQCYITARLIFDAMRDRHYLTLPPHPEQGTDGVVITVIYMHAINRPYPMGRDADGLFAYRSEYVLTYSG